jgi:hypothetical protein
MYSKLATNRGCRYRRAEIFWQDYSKLLCSSTPQEAIDFACALGALVAENKGANPIISNLEINMF